MFFDIQQTRVSISFLLWYTHAAMDEKTLHTLEFPKILQRLASYTSFEPSAEKALALRPTNDIAEARRRLAETNEAIRLQASHSVLRLMDCMIYARQWTWQSTAGCYLPPIYWISSLFWQMHVL